MRNRWKLIAFFCAVLMISAAVSVVLVVKQHRQNRQIQTTLVPLVNTSSFSELTTELPNIANQAPTAAEPISQSAVDSQIDEIGSSAAQPLAAGGQMCIVRTAFADTWSADPNDATFIPTLTPLPAGTLDFVTGQSQVYDADLKDWRYFFRLSSGRKVRSDAVELLSSPTPQSNTIRVQSSAAQNGALQIALKMDWNVPFDFSTQPQSFYEGNSEHFNVASFDATQIVFTFHYTTAASGSLSTVGSDVISAAGWQIDQAQKSASLILALREKGRYYGYRIERRDDGLTILTIRSRPKSLSGSVIVLDPGHGGKDSGALGFSGGVKESQLNFALAVAAKNELERRGAVVYLTRYDDTYYTLEERKAYARAVNPDLFLSIHCNAAENPERHGTAVYYYRPMSQPLANSIYTQLLSVFQNQFYAGSAKAASSAEGQIFHPFSVTRLEECPSVLIETGFITNNEECMLLLNANNRDKVAAAIANGIEAYLR